MRKESSRAVDPTKVLSALANRPALKPLRGAALMVAKHRRQIRQAMRMGHSLTTIATQLKVPKSTLQRHINDAGLFWRKPRTKKGRAVKQNLSAIKRAKLAAMANV